MSLYYEPCARITVGNLVFPSVNQVVITESVKELGDKAVVTLPRNYRELNGKSVFDYFKVGDKVTIELGTDGKYFTEFTGYLGEITTDTPMVLEVDDNFYPLKRNSFKKSWANVSLKDLLTYVAPAYTIDCADVDLGAFQIDNVSTYKVMQALVEQYGFYTKISSDNKLKCYWPLSFNTNNKYTYKFGNNIKRNDLKFHREEDIKLRVKGISPQRTGKKLIYEMGPEGNDVTLRTRNFTTLTYDALVKAVKEDYKLFAFNGYSGSITGFAIPRTHAGDTLTIIDDNEADREGDYFIEKTIIRYSLTGGFERENTLSFKR